MSDSRKTLRTAAIVVLAICVLIVAIPLVGAIIGYTVSILLGIAVAVIKVAVVVAVIYLVLVGVRAALR